MFKMKADNSPTQRFFNAPLAETDPEIADAINKELGRQQYEIELIASENIVSKAVLEAAGSVLTNKYAEGYPGKRYYGGCQYVDIVEQLAIDRAKKIFGCGFANVQPNSGLAGQPGCVQRCSPSRATPSSACNLAHGGHLTHGAHGQPVRQVVPRRALPGRARYASRRHEQGARDRPGRKAPHHHRRRLGLSAPVRLRCLPRHRGRGRRASRWSTWPHFAGLVAAGEHPSPFPHAHVVTTTTHKTLRGPRGGMILTNDEDIAKKINSAIFPGIQGGPLMHVIAGKAVAFGEILQPEFKAYAKQVIVNAKAMGEVLVNAGFALVSGGTDTHLILVDLRPKKLTGNISEKSMERAHITCNKNGVPFDPEKPMVTSGIRLGAPAGTTRGFGEAEFRDIGRMIAEVLDGLAKNGEAGNGRCRREDQGGGDRALQALPDLLVITMESPRS